MSEYVGATFFVLAIVIMWELHRLNKAVDRIEYVLSLWLAADN